MRILRIILWIAAIGAVTVAVLIWAADSTVRRATDDKVYDSAESIPVNRVGLLLGTSPTLRSGRPNEYFYNRVNAAVTLYRAGKIKYIVVSGDNGNRGYNEPQAMRDALVEQGIPEMVIYLDYAGFRTLDSVIRLEKIFGQSEFTVISQEFHNRRAIYIATALGMNAVGYDAADVNAYNGVKTKIRELLARVKMFLDLWTGKSPRFLGEKIEIGK